MRQRRGKINKGKRGKERKEEIGKRERREWRKEGYEARNKLEDGKPK